MSDANIKLVQDAYAAFGRGDIPACLAMFTPDGAIGIVGRREDAPFLGMFSGKDVPEFFKQLDAAHAISKFEPLRFLAADEKVFVWGRYAWTMRNSGVSDETTWLHEITVRDGKMSEWRGHNDTAMLAAHYHGASRGDANIKLIQDIYAAFGRKDLPAVLDALTPDVTWGMVGHAEDVPMAGIRNGKAGAAEFFKLLAQTNEMRNFTPQKFSAAEDMVLVWGRYDWTMRSNGAEGESEFLHVWTIRDGKVCQWRGHQDTAKLARAHHAAPAKVAVSA